jgi:hypothetical protein
MAKRKRRKPGVVPRLGPATNLRPAGAHESLKLYNRRRMKAALRREAESGFPFETDTRAD